MKKLAVLLVCCCLSACELMGMHKCDALSGWCVSSKFEYFEYYSWYTEKEIKHTKSGGYKFEMKNRDIEIENKKRILLSCHIEPDSGAILNNFSKEKAYSCAYDKGICLLYREEYKQFNCN